MRITSCPNSCKRCFVFIPSTTPVVRPYNSASAELKLTVCCVLDHAVSVAFPHCTTPPLVLLHVVACPDQSLSVCTFTNFETPGHCFCHASSQPASFSETTSTVLVKTSRTDIDCSLSRLTLISLFHLSHDLPIAFESFTCQLLQSFSQLSSYPFLSVS